MKNNADFNVWLPDLCKPFLRLVSGRFFYCLPEHLGVTIRDEFLPLFVVVHEENILNGTTATTYCDHRLTLTLPLHIVSNNLQLVCCSSVLTSHTIKYYSCIAGSIL